MAEQLVGGGAAPFLSSNVVVHLPCTCLHYCSKLQRWSRICATPELAVVFWGDVRTVHTLLGNHTAYTLQTDPHRKPPDMPANGHPIRFSQSELTVRSQSFARYENQQRIYQLEPKTMTLLFYHCSSANEQVPATILGPSQHPGEYLRTEYEEVNGKAVIHEAAALHRLEFHIRNPSCANAGGYLHVVHQPFCCVRSGCHSEYKRLMRYTFPS
uniref:Uncharacterized protein n=1 Tax=Eutreptiella gymnastica TaxID=73025 RepID=A0A7S4FT21_9EUGL